MSTTTASISPNMSHIHSQDTSIELLLRRALWEKGYRYRKNYKMLPGSPDIVLDWEILKLRLKKGNNPDFWIKKIERNQARDWENDKKLLFLGYTVFHFWGQDIKTHTAECLKAIEESIWEDKISNTELPELTEGDVF